MTRRTKAREVVLQLLYADDMNPGRRLADDEAFVRERLENDAPLIKFAIDLLNGVRRNRNRLDEQLGKLATNWSMQRMAVTDRNVLRIGAFEVLFDETPDRVAVNEAVELAKRFGAKQSAPFVNGVLDRLMHEKKNPPATES